MISRPVLMDKCDDKQNDPNQNDGLVKLTLEDVLS